MVSTEVPVAPLRLAVAFIVDVDVVLDGVNDALVRFGRPLAVTHTRLRHRAYRLKVTVSIAGAGANEGAIATEPVYHAAIKIGRDTTYTNRNGVAVITPRHTQRVTITAADTLVPTSTHLGRPPRHGPRRPRSRNRRVH
ncbi:MAG TPA: hypothetical protein VE570_15600 [Thermoleophilaceae bacterium]|jgi:hypothetical protein|nr:hypothetical protein [Thermoleophilaceae bacterium]